jgi:hypothetical protein
MVISSAGVHAAAFPFTIWLLCCTTIKSWCGGLQSQLQSISPA